MFSLFSYMHTFFRIRPLGYLKCNLCPMIIYQDRVYLGSEQQVMN